MNISTGDIIKVRGDDTKWVVLDHWDGEVTAYCAALPDFGTEGLPTFSFDQIEEVQTRTFNPKVGDYISGRPEYDEDWGNDDPAFVNSAQIFEVLEDGRFQAHWVLEDNWYYPDHFFVIFSKENISECLSVHDDTSPSCPDGEYCSATEEGRQNMAAHSEAREGKAKVVLVTGTILTVALAALSLYLGTIWTALFTIVVGASLTNLYGKWRFRNPKPYTYEGDPRR
jgi:hypothetical protein